MSDGSWLDRRAARRWFERADTDPEADPLAREVERRMASRLDYVKLAPTAILDVGSGAAGAPVRERFADAATVAVDWALPRLRRAAGPRSLAARARALLGGAGRRAACADLGALPFAAASFDLVWSNLALAWSGDPPAALREWHRVLRVGGLLMFSTYGPDTLAELRDAFAGDTMPHVHPFMDMHDVGDALVQAGFADPVIDMEMMTLTYAGIDGLVSDLRATGQRNALALRRRTLTGRRRWQSMRGAYAARARGGALPARFEIVYGHAWKAPPRASADGRSIIRFDPPLRRRKND